MKFRIEVFKCKMLVRKLVRSEDDRFYNLSIYYIGYLNFRINLVFNVVGVLGWKLIENVFCLFS